MNQLINRMDTYKSEIKGVDNQISNLESQISNASRNISDLTNEANTASNTISNTINSSKKAENNAKRAAIQQEIANLEAEEYASNYNVWNGSKINDLKDELANLPEYATGTRYSVGGEIIKDENGYELTLSPTGGGRYAMAKEGSQIFTSDMTDALWNFSNNPAKFMMDKLESLSNSGISNISNISKTNNSPVKVEIPIIVHGTADESILNGLKAERKNILDKVYVGLNSMNRRAGNNFGI